MLELEIEYYESKLNELLADSKGKFVLIKGESIIGIYDSEADAYSDGLSKIGNEPFLIKQIAESDGIDVTMPAYSLGMINANI